MADYTQKIENTIFDINYSDLDNEEFKELIIQQVKQFRTFDEAITVFIKEHGFSGDDTSNEDRISFILKLFKDADIESPRFIKNWFTEKKGISKIPTGFQFCFAFHLGVEESNDFFRRICLEDSINCHDIKEAVYYYCLKNDISYKDAQAVIDDLVKPTGNYEIEDIPYTKAIQQDLDRINSLSDLKEYLLKNVEFFYQNKKRATENIQDLWEMISKHNGTADQELGFCYHFYYDNVENEVTAKKIDSKLGKRSTWEIYKQIVRGQGPSKDPFDKNGSNDTAIIKEDEKIEKERSIKSILQYNPLFHKLVEKDFPNRQVIDKINRGEAASVEGIRKTLILFTFYNFWAQKAIERCNYDAKPKEADECLCIIDNILQESGYQPLYYGNPYDWIFLLCSNSEAPLESFHNYMNEFNF